MKSLNLYNLTSSRKITLSIVVCLLSMHLLASHALAKDKPVTWQGKLSVYKPEKASPGYTLYPVTGNNETILLNMKGEIIHRWPLDAMRARLLPNCNLLVIHGSKKGIHEERWKTLKNRVMEYNWDGELVWEYIADDRVHHDVVRTEKGTTIFPVKSKLTKEQKEKIKDPKRKKLKIRSDIILEVNKKGEVVWQWDAAKHLDLNSCGSSNCRQASDWTHINTTMPIPPNHWYEQGDKRFKPGNLMILPRSWWQAMIIERESGKVLWDYTGDYKGGLSGGHEAHMIPKGYPGAGNILLFDNGRLKHRGRSYALEINPVTKELVWIYDVDKKFFSRSAGALQRLKNGNTLLSEDLTGRVFEVTPDSETVWEFKGNMGVARARRYPINFCPKLK